MFQSSKRGNKSVSLLVTVLIILVGMLVIQPVKAQAASDYVNVSATSWSPGENPQSKTITVTSNTTWSVIETCNWISVSKTSGSNNGSFNINVAPNSGSARSAIVVVKAGSVVRNITVNQSGITFFVATSSVIANAPATTGEVGVITSQTWSASSDSSWLTVTTKSGSGQSKVTYSLATNMFGGDRIGYITISCGSLKSKIKVTQKAAVLSIATNSVKSNPIKSTYSINVVSSNTWTASTDVSWITINTISGSGQTKIKFTIADNPQSTSRVGKVTVRTGPLAEVITVTQNGVTLAVASNITISPNKTTAEQTVTTNFKWVAVSNASWLTVTNGSGTNTGKFTYTAAVNPNGTARTGYITVACGAVVKTIAITQQGIQISIGKSTLNVGPEAGASSFSVSSNYSAWSVTTGNTWITTTKSSANNIKLSYGTNTKSTNRTYTITVVAGNVKKQCVVTQSGRYIKAGVESLVADSKAQSKNIAIDTNGNWRVLVNSNDWFTVTINTSSITINFKENTSTTKDRMEWITVVSGEVSVPILIGQDKKSKLDISNIDLKSVQEYFGSGKFLAPNLEAPLIQISSNFDWTISTTDSWIYYEIFDYDAVSNQSKKLTSSKVYKSFSGKAGKRYGVRIGVDFLSGYNESTKSYSITDRIRGSEVKITNGRESTTLKIKQTPNKSINGANIEDAKKEFKKLIAMLDEKDVKYFYEPTPTDKPITGIETIQGKNGESDKVTPRNYIIQSGVDQNNDFYVSYVIFTVSGTRFDVMERYNQYEVACELRIEESYHLKITECEYEYSLDSENPDLISPVTITSKTSSSIVSDIIGGAQLGQYLASGVDTILTFVPGIQAKVARLVLKQGENAFIGNTQEKVKLESEKGSLSTMNYFSNNYMSYSNPAMLAADKNLCKSILYTFSGTKEKDGYSNAGDGFEVKACINGIGKKNLEKSNELLERYKDSWEKEYLKYSERLFIGVVSPITWKNHSNPTEKNEVYKVNIMNYRNLRYYTRG